MNTTAYADQFEAASRDAVRQLKEMARRAELNPVLPTVALPLGSWLRDQLCGVIACLEAGTAVYCKHIGASPQVMYTTAWKPGQFVCQDCLHTLRAKTLAEDFTCDQCQQHHDTIHSRVAAIGPVLFAYGRCTRCLDPLTGA